MSDWTLIGKYLSGNMSADEAGQVEDRLLSDEKFRSDFEKAQIIWQGAAIDIMEIPDTDREWIRFRSRIEVLEGIEKKKSPVITLAWTIPLAASLLAVAFFLGLTTSGQQEYPEETYAITAGKSSGKVKQGIIVRKKEFFEVITTSDRRVIYLPDSTHVTMSAGSRLEYAPGFGEEHRVLSLDGEAFFDVKRDTTLTFEILTEKARTTVLGTSFNLRAYTQEDSITLLVASGLVDFEADQVFSASLTRDDYMAFYKESSRYAVRKTARKKEKLKIIEPLDANNSIKTRINIIDSLSLVYTIDYKSKKTVFRPTIYNHSENYSAGNIRIEVTAYDEERKKTGTRVFTVTKDVKPGDSLLMREKIRSKWFSQVDSLSAVIIEASETSVYEKRDE